MAFAKLGNLWAGESLMTRIRAFVGHSFTDDDEEVVRRFLTYFEQLSKLDIDFSWDHAEAAEPKLLAAKVMSLLSDKNVFVGICTKKERVIPGASLTRALFRPSILQAQTIEFAWKTSDWIIQEIGLAKGLILLYFGLLILTLCARHWCAPQARGVNFNLERA